MQTVDFEQSSGSATMTLDGNVHNYNSPIVTIGYNTAVVSVRINDVVYIFVPGVDSITIGGVLMTSQTPAQIANLLSTTIFNASSGGGTVAVTDVEKIYNVKSYGAKGDGSTDDTIAIQAAISACHAAGGGTVWFPNGVYIIGGAIQTSVGGLDMNAQLYIPVGTANNTLVTINLVGEGGTSPGNAIQSPFSVTAVSTNGVYLYSTYTGTRSTTVIGTAIIGTGLGNANCLNVLNIGFLAKSNPNSNGPEIGGVSGKNLNGLNIFNCTYGIDTVVSSFVTPTRDISGFEFPDTALGACYNAKNLSAYGVKWGFLLGEHVSGDMLSSALCINAFGFKSGDHASFFGRINSYWCVNALSWHAAGLADFGPYNIFVSQLDIEFGTGNAGKYYNSVNGVLDASNRLSGIVFFSSVTQGVAHNNATFIKSGGTGVNCYGIGDGAIVGPDPTALVWDATNKRLGIGNTPATDSHIKKGANAQVIARVENTTSGVNAQSLFQVLNDTGGGGQLGTRSTLTTNYGDLVALCTYIYTGAAAGLAFMVDANGPITFSTGSGAPAAERFKIDGSGNFTFAIGKFGITEGTNGRVGQTTLVAGTIAITISGVTTSSRGFVQLVTPGSASSTIQYKAVCTSNTLTITALVAAGTINTSDVSTFNYFVIN